MGSVQTAGSACQNRIELWDSQLASESEKWCWKNIVAGRKRHTGAERTHEAQGSLCEDPGVGRSGMGFGRAWDGWVPVAAAIGERDKGAQGGGVWVAWKLDLKPQAVGPSPP